MPQKDDTKLISAIEHLTAELTATRAAKNSILRSFGSSVLRGVAFAFGALLAIGILGALVAWWISSFNLFPVIGGWISNLLLSIEIPEKFLALREMRGN